MHWRKMKKTPALQVSHQVLIISIRFHLAVLPTHANPGRKVSTEAHFLWVKQFASIIMALWDTNDIPQQGGNNLAVRHLWYEPGAFHVNITAVPWSGAGHVRIYPANRGRPNASILNWDWFVGNIANAASVDSYESSANNEFCIYIGGTGGVDPCYHGCHGIL